MIEPKIVQLPKLTDPRGNLSFIEEQNHIPFKIERTYWIHDVPGGDRRLGRATRNASEFIVSLTGSFDVTLKTGLNIEKFHLCRSYYGLYIPPMTWREIDNFSTNSLALVLTDCLFNDSIYVRDFDEYIRMKNEK